MDDLERIEKALGKKNVNILFTFASFVHGECHSFASKNISDKDLILLIDAKQVPAEDRILIRKKDNVRIHTLKESSREKYNELYEKKLFSIFNRVTSDRL